MDPTRSLLMLCRWKISISSSYTIHDDTILHGLPGEIEWNFSKFIVGQMGSCLPDSDRNHLNCETSRARESLTWLG